MDEESRYLGLNFDTVDIFLGHLTLTLFALNSSVSKFPLRETSAYLSYTF